MYSSEVGGFVGNYRSMKAVVDSSRGYSGNSEMSQKVGNISGSVQSLSTFGANSIRFSRLRSSAPSTGPAL